MSTAQSPCRFEEAERGVLVVSPRPELNDVQWADIEQIGDGILQRVQSQQRPRVVIDLLELNYMGSAMVALIVRVWKSVDERSGKMAVANRSDLVGEVLELAGLSKKWMMVESREEAISAIGGGIGSGSDQSVGGGMLMAVGAIVCAIVACIGLVAMMEDMMAKGPAVAMLCLGGLAGIAFGGLSVAGGSGIGRILGILGGAGSVIMLVVGVVALASQVDTPPPPPEQESPSLDEDLGPADELTPSDVPPALPDFPPVESAGTESGSGVVSEETISVETEEPAEESTTAEENNTESEPTPSAESSVE
ncbi:STAS domain-containing protein [Calycomorphotria hydatis]|uniref:STAS domain-containing protein n=1 Tax=Calycomorphotria hydatis TaxID=2528027 RepID=A0A517TAX9_9PLAN|nr:STAS domain-containing protein [Calycomorphotria hydatis]QDT65524.1 hypothetical protein V22_27790 [Calycomorphotria hydatis]